MKKALAYILIVLCIIVLGAHFLRDASWIAVYGCAALLGLLFVRRAWVARVVQAVLVLGALEWLRTLVVLAQMRAALGEPYTRMAVILGIVAAVTLMSALLFQSSALREIYGVAGPAKAPGSAD